MKTRTSLVIFFLGLTALGTIQSTLAQVLNYKTTVTIDDKGIKSTRKTILIQVNNKQENWLSHVEITHNPKQDFSFNYARIIDPNGNVQGKIKKKDLRTRSDLSHQAFYQDDLITEFNLYWDQYPYQVEYSYTITEEEYLFAAWWTPLLYANVPTLESSLELGVPAGYKFQMDQTGNLVYKESTVENKKIYSWRSSLVKGMKQEMYSPKMRELIPMISIVPSRFKYGVSGRSDSWSSFGAWLNALNEGTDRLPYHEKVALENLVHGIPGKREIIKRLYYYLQDETRYVNVAIDVGGLKSYPASYVCENKYGDCKALTTYMKSMLQSVGIESYYTVINAGSHQAKINVDFPSQQFNHVILAVPLERDTVWLENTSNALPFNYLGTFTQNRYALAVNGEQSQLVKTPALLPAHVLLERNYKFQVSGAHSAQVDLSLALRGKEFEDARYFIADNDEKKQNAEVLNHINIKEFDLDEWKIFDFHRDSSVVQIMIRGQSPGIVREIGSFKVINPLKITLPGFEKPGERSLDLRISYPVNKLDKSIYDVSGLKLNAVQLPKGIHIEGPYGQYTTSYTRGNSTLTVQEKFTLLTNEIPINQYQEFYSFIDSIIAHKKRSAILLK